MGHLLLQLPQDIDKGRVFKGMRGRHPAQRGTGIGQQGADGGCGAEGGLQILVVVMGAFAADGVGTDPAVPLFQRFQVFDAQDVVGIVEQKGIILRFHVGGKGILPRGGKGHALL